MKLLGRPAAFRRLSASIAAGVLAVMFLSAPATTSPMPAATDSVGETSTAAAKGETRLRKLHLVRPDLIPYPIAFEVYC